jgi:predicted O-methyltransferase YrrM
VRIVAIATSGTVLIGGALFIVGLREWAIAVWTGTVAAIVWLVYSRVSRLGILTRTVVGELRAFRADVEGMFAETLDALRSLDEATNASVQGYREDHERMVAEVHSSLSSVRNGIVGQMDRDFKQVDRLIALHASFDFRGLLPPSRHWAASPDLLALLARLVAETRSVTVVECGSGTSTIVIAYALERLALPNSKVYALEHDEYYRDVTKRAIADHGIQKWAEVVDAPLIDVTVSDEIFQWYDLNALSSEIDAIDILLVDGPPDRTGPMARYPALPLLRNWLHDRSVVILDDLVRESERKVLERWAAEFPEASIDKLPLEKGCALLRLSGSGRDR